MAERSLMALMAAGLRGKAAVGPTSGLGPLRELSGVGFPREPFSGAWQRNMTTAGTGTLLSYSPIYACTTRIASDIAKLAISLMSRDGNGIDVLAPKTSPYWAVLRKPNGYQDRIKFIRYWLTCKLIFGNSYAIKFYDARGIVTDLYLIDPRKVCPVVAPDGAVYYSIASDELSRIPAGLAYAPAADVIHDRMCTLWHPLVGVPPLYAAALSGTLGLAIQQQSSAFFKNASRPSGLLTSPGTIDDVTYQRLKKDWDDNHSGMNAGKLAILGDGLEYSAMSMAAEQSQLAEQLGLTAIDVATAYSMPAYKINQGPMPTNNNIGALNQQYYGDCLQTQIEDIELCLDEGLALPDGYSCQFDLDGLLRTDPASLYAALGVAADKSIMTPNEARRRINLGPKPGGDSLYKQQQEHSLAALEKRDSGPDPFGTAKPPPAPAPAAAPTPEPAPAPPPKSIAAAFLKGLITELDAEVA